MEQVILDISNPKHAHADERLRKEIIVWIGTVRPDGRPHMVPVWFYWDGATILVLSKPDQKIRNLQRNPRVIISVDNTAEGSDVISVEGEATIVERREVAAVLPAYAEKYGAQLKRFGWTIESMSQEYSETIRIAPSKFRV